MELEIEGLGPATEIGVGASAVVYRAEQEGLGREIAVKVLSATDDAFIRRFEREAKTLGKLSQNPGIVTVYQTGVTETGHPYLILELCQQSMLQQVRAEGPFEPLDACRAAAQVAEAVDAAHREGVVHRDLKPANVLLARNGRYMVTDFGVSTVSGSTTGHTESVGFTAGYVAPETLQNIPAGPAADVYAIGATLYHLLTGQAPHVDRNSHLNLLALAQRIINDPVPDLRARGIPHDVARIVELAMAKNPADRPSAHLLHEYLAQAAAGEQVTFLGQARSTSSITGEFQRSSPAADITDNSFDTADGYRAADGVGDFDETAPEPMTATGRVVRNHHGVGWDAKTTTVSTDSEAAGNALGPATAMAAGGIGAAATAAGLSADNGEIDEQPVTFEADLVSGDGSGFDDPTGPLWVEPGPTGEVPVVETGKGPVGAAAPDGAGEIDLRDEAPISDLDPVSTAPIDPEDLPVGRAATPATFDPVATGGAGATDPLANLIAGTDLDPSNTGGFPPPSFDGSPAVPSPTTRGSVPPPPLPDQPSLPPPPIGDPAADATDVTPSAPGSTLDTVDGAQIPPPRAETDPVALGRLTASPFRPDSDGGSGGRPGIGAAGVAVPPVLIPASPAEKRWFWFNSDHRRQFAPLLVVAGLGLLGLIAVAAFLTLRDDGDARATDQTATEADNAAADNAAADNAAADDAVRSSGAQIELDDLTGLEADVAARRLEAGGFTVVRTVEETNEVAPGVVIRQNPPPGERVEAGEVVELVEAVADGVEVPILAGLPQEEAEARLSELGLVGQAVGEFSNVVEPGRVIFSDPEEGGYVELGAAVQLSVARLPRCADVAGGTGPGARQVFESVGIGVSTSNSFSDTVADGILISCELQGGTANLVISDGRSPCSEAIGIALQDAENRLGERGFSTSENGRPATQGEIGNVVDCNLEELTVNLTYISAVVPTDCSDTIGRRRGRAVNSLEDQGFADIRVNEEPDPDSPGNTVTNCVVDLETAGVTLTVSPGPTIGNLRVRVDQLVLSPGQDCGGEGVRPDLGGEVVLTYAGQDEAVGGIRRPNRRGVVDIGSNVEWNDVEPGRQLTMSWSMIDDDGAQNDPVGAGNASVAINGEPLNWQPTSGGDDACQFSWVVSVEWRPNS